MKKKFKKEELTTFRPAIYRNLLQISKDCIKSTLKRNTEKPFSLELTKEGADFLMKRFDNDDIDEFDTEKKYDTATYNNLQILWKDPTIREVFEKYRAIDFHIFDGADYFFQTDILSRIYTPDKYFPTEEDIIRCRKKTIGIVELSFLYNDVKFKLVDVGGQKNERKKWENAFKGVNVVLFVASLGDYDQLMYEDDTTNRMLESLQLFDKIINGSWLAEKKNYFIFK